MAADEIERADETAVAPAIAQAAFDPALAIAKELQEKIEDFDGCGGVARAHEITPPDPRVTCARTAAARLPSCLISMTRMQIIPSFWSRSSAGFSSRRGGRLGARQSHGRSSWQLGLRGSSGHMRPYPPSRCIMGVSLAPGGAGASVETRLGSTAVGIAVGRGIGNGRQRLWCGVQMPI